MPVTAEFIFDFGSPNAYLSHRVLPAIVARTGVPFAYVPALLGGIFKATGNASPMVAFAGVRNKLEYQALETRRFMEKHGIDNYKRNDHFPVNTLQLMRGAVYARDKQFYPRYIEAMYRAMWELNLDMTQPDVMAKTLAEADLPAEEIMAAIQNSEVKQGLIDFTSASVARGTFGSPTFYVGDEIFFGKDRLRDVEELLISRA